MAAIDNQAVFSASHRKTAIVATLVAAFQDWNAARQTRNMLSKLSDRELEDIGLCRGDIDAVSGR